MIMFRKGIIEGKIEDGILTVTLENTSISDKEININTWEIERFLEDNDYIIYKKKGSNNIRFTKSFIHNRLQQYLDDTGRTQAFLAKRLNVERSVISRLCKANNVELQTAYMISTILNANINEIFPPKNLEYLQFQK